MLVMRVREQDAADEVVIVVPPSEKETRIVVKVIEGYPRLGFDAPRKVTIDRRSVRASKEADGSRGAAAKDGRRGGRDGSESRATEKVA